MARQAMERRPEYAPGFSALPAYPLAGIPELRRKLEAEGADVIDLGAGGEGYFRAALTVPPDRIREAAARLGKLLR